MPSEQSTPNQESVDKTNALLPLRLTLKGQVDELRDLSNYPPPFHLDLRQEGVTLTIGYTESYSLPLAETAFESLLQEFSLQDFKSKQYFYNPYFGYGGYLETQKEIEGKLYARKMTNFRRSDIEVKYMGMDSASIRRFTRLADYANKVVLHFLKDQVNKDTMITAWSLKEALAQPEKVYRLMLRNSKVKVLPPEIGQLVNMRILNISGSWIKSIPPEIEHCKELRQLIANASRLEEVPASIGNLKKLRTINFGYCRIKSIPPELGKLTTLWDLGLGANRLTELPKEIENLKNVLFFSVADNNFDTFPSAALGLSSVMNLWMHGNEFNYVPPEIAQLQELSHFLVDAQEIDNLEEIQQLRPALRIIDEHNR